MLNKRPLLVIIGVFVALAVFVLLFAERAGEHYDQNIIVTPNGTRLKVEVANTEAKRKLGLSGRQSMAVDEGMLFAFDEARQQCMWMKDMRFSLDMVWLDTQKKITGISKNINPETYPKNFCSEGRYVLEINAGTARRLNLQLGQSISPID